MGRRWAGLGVSGGQTGVDRGALDAFIAAGVPHAGFCPQGRRAEDGRIPAKYAMTETESRGYRDRTELNVARADGTLILCFGPGPLSGGTRETLDTVRRLGRHGHVCDVRAIRYSENVANWMRDVRIAALNVAGPRESKCPGIHVLALRFVSAVLLALELP